MKILVFNHSFFYLSETFIYRQVTGIPKEFDATLMSYVFANENYFPTSNKKKHIKWSVNIIDRLITFSFKHILRKPLAVSLFTTAVIRKYLKEEKFEAIHVHFGFNATSLLPLIKEQNIPLVVSFHGIDASPEYLNQPKYKAQLTELFNYARAVIVVSPHMIDSLGLSKWKEKTHLIPYGINPAEFTNTADPLREKKTINILHSGRMVSKKGIPDLIKVFANLSKTYPNLQLDIVGDGAELEPCKQLVQELNLDNVYFRGSQPIAEVKKYMSDADIFVLNSRTGEKGDMEGFPNSIIEAMSMGAPVVSTYHAGIPMAIEDGVTGFLVNEKDNEALQTALEKLIKDKDLRLSMGKQARIKVENEFTLERTNQMIADIYRSI